MSNEVNVKFKKLNPDAMTPMYQSKLAAGFDLHACLKKDGIMDEIKIDIGDIKLVPIQIAVEIPEGFEMQVRPRSGLATKGISVVNSPGTIDSDYRGEVKVILQNRGTSSFIVKHGDRIAQGIIAPVMRGIFTEVDELSATERGEGGFGSSGINHKQSITSIPVENIIVEGPNGSISSRS